jgi:signal transduction histidine kinase
VRVEAGPLAGSPTRISSTGMSARMLVARAIHRIDFQKMRRSAMVSMIRRRQLAHSSDFSLQSEGRLLRLNLTVTVRCVEPNLASESASAVIHAKTYAVTEAKMANLHPKFTVDTKLFRELGELLVGRDSTAVVELIKNSYDADATIVSVLGENLNSPARGRIVITDDGVGMTKENFEKGFLRSGSRLKERGDRRSPIYERRYTGEKGVGRLAAHKLAKRMDLISVPDPETTNDSAGAIEATVDWDRIEAYETLDDIKDLDDGPITLRELRSNDTPGTEIELTKLRKKWTNSERTRLFEELGTFLPPELLIEIPKNVASSDLLIDKVAVRDVRGSDDPGFNIELLGDFDVGEEYWKVVAQAADWILEIDAKGKSSRIDYRITPTLTCKRNFPDAEQHNFKWNDPSLDEFPTFQARVLIREGSEGVQRSTRSWLNRNAGIRVYMEGFRVLPYGEAGNDWLEIDSDYVRRSRTLRFLDDVPFDLPSNSRSDADEDIGLMQLPNQSYYGAAFLTRKSSASLEMLVNREGFIPNAAYMAMQKIIRRGVDLSVRVRAYEKQPQREARRKERIEKAKQLDRFETRKAAEEAARNATELAANARRVAATGKYAEAKRLIVSAANEVKRSASYTSELMSDRSIMQVLAGVGLQMTAFVHEMNGLLGMASALESTVERFRKNVKLDAESRQEMSRVFQSVSDLRNIVERQASYLTDITSPDARRRRSRQRLAERFDSCVRLVQRGASKRQVRVLNQIPIDLRSPPMFPAELMVIFSNLLTNAIKACDRNGRIRAKGREKSDGSVIVRIENTGRRVRLNDSEKWFLPFRSTTIEADPSLGQGMGMGLPIARNILEEYGASIGFAEPGEGFATALEITFV